MMRRSIAVLGACFWMLLAERSGASQELPRGQVIDSVQCAADSTQSYSLYLPAAYTPERAWPLLMGFHPGARGRAIVDKYRDAAERYGYIVAASNNSRNGPWEVSGRAVTAMAQDLGTRFSTDPKRLYATGHSGGARVALQLALRNPVAGVIASSAGFADREPHVKLSFAFFGTAGDTDFNYVEMKMLDRTLKSPHRVVIFHGGHTLPPDEVAMEAIEWMELQGIKSAIRPRDDALVASLWTRRLEAAMAAGNPVKTVPLLQALVEDFKGLRDVQPQTDSIAQLLKDSATKRALDRQREADQSELRTLEDFGRLEAGLADSATRNDSYGDLRRLLEDCRKKATAPDDSGQRDAARRILRVVTMGAAERVQDQEYLKLLQKYR
jgi:poly(3-hydroxybutyrate) depolymerase